MSPAEILAAMQRAQFCICMRFHSVLFAHELGIPYLAVDYTSGGKIHAFLSARDSLSRLIDLEELINSDPATKVLEQVSTSQL